MLDSFPFPASTAPDLGAPAARPGASSTVPGPASGQAQGQAQGQAAIEIFTSFNALVDALAGESIGASNGTKGEMPVEGAPAAEQKPERHDDRIVMPLDIAALLMPHFVVTKAGPHTGAALQGDVHPKSSPSPNPNPIFGNDESASAHELALMLLGTRGVSTDVVNAIADDALNGDDAAGLPLGPLASAAARGGSEADGAALAQAVIQRLLAAAASGPQKMAAELAQPSAGRPQTAVDDLVRHLVMQADQAKPGTTAPAARLITPHTSELTTATAHSFAADAIASTSTLLEAPSTNTADQIVQAIRLQWARGGGEAHIRLEPHQFGDMTVSVRVDQGQVVARLHTDTPVIREWLQANQQLLRQSLSEHNLTLSRLEVSEPNNDTRQGTSRNGQDQQAEREGKPSRRPKSPDTGETFEILI